MRTTIYCSLLLLILFSNCGPTDDPRSASPTLSSASPYLNHSDSAKYVGMNSCRSCHQDIYNTFIKTGMGSSFGLADKSKSAVTAIKAKGLTKDFPAAQHLVAMLSLDNSYNSDDLIGFDRKAPIRNHSTLHA